MKKKEKKKGHGSRQVMLSQEAYEYLDGVRSMLPDKENRAASFSDAVKFHIGIHENIYSIISTNFKKLNKLLLSYYSGNSSKAHISNQLQNVLTKATKSDKDYEYVSRKLKEIMGDND